MMSLTVRKVQMLHESENSHVMLDPVTMACPYIVGGGYSFQIQRVAVNISSP